MDADANPLPKDDTTPPVTKMNLVLTVAIAASPFTRQIFFRSLKILRSIDFHRSLVNFSHVNSINRFLMRESCSKLSIRSNAVGPEPSFTKSELQLWQEKKTTVAYHPKNKKP